jgi:hypothetical protein
MASNLHPYQERLLRDIRDRVAAVERVLQRDNTEIDLGSMRTVSSQLSQCSIDVANLVGSMELLASMAHFEKKTPR